MGDITINEFINKGLDVINSPLSNFISDHVNVRVASSLITSMIVYRSVVNLYLKSAYNSSSIVNLMGSTNSKEVSLFMIFGAPAIVGSIMAINAVTLGGANKVIINIEESSGLVDSSSTLSSSSLFLLFNKLPSWLRVILKYVVLYYITIFILGVIGYNSTIIKDIYSYGGVFLIYFLKLFCILNFLVAIYYIIKIYILKMYEINKEFILPDNYSKYIKKELTYLKEISIKGTAEERSKIVIFYFKLSLLYSVISISNFILMIYIQ